MLLSHPAAPDLCPILGNQSSSKCSDPLVLGALEQIHQVSQNQQGPWEPPVYSQPVSSTGDTLDVRLALKGTVCGTEPLTYGVSFESEGETQEEECVFPRHVWP